MMFDSPMLDDYRYPCILMERVREPDGMGGNRYVWTDGMQFDVVFAVDATPEAIIAEKQGIKRTYIATVHKNMVLKYHDVLRRIEDSKIFRVTNDGDDKKTPHTTNLDARGLELERWELPGNE